MRASLFAPRLSFEKLPFRHLATDTSDSMVTGLRAEWWEGKKAGRTHGPFNVIREIIVHICSRTLLGKPLLFEPYKVHIF